MTNSPSMRNMLLTAMLIAFIGAAGLGGCAGMAPTGDEEGGTMLGLDETFDQTRRGAHLVMNYDKAQNAFVGTVTNATSATLRAVRVEVHLDNGVELGPTTAQDLARGQSMSVQLPAGEQTFTGWVPHAEVGPQSGSGGEGGGEHGGEGGGEHGSGGERSAGGAG